jgi:hypothetical protein
VLAVVGGLFFLGGGGAPSSHHQHPPPYIKPINQPTNFFDFSKNKRKLNKIKIIL